MPCSKYWNQLPLFGACRTFRAAFAAVSLLALVLAGCAHVGPSPQKRIQTAQTRQATLEYKVGKLYQNGTSVTQDYGRAAALYRKAAAGGNADAMNALGLLYYYGHGTARDYKQALTWFRRAAAKRNPAGQYNIGLAYDNGQGVKQSYPKAMEWYRKAAQGYAEAENNLGVLYAFGWGVPQIPLPHSCGIRKPLEGTRPCGSAIWRLTIRRGGVSNRTTQGRVIGFTSLRHRVIRLPKKHSAPWALLHLLQRKRRLWLLADPIGLAGG